VLYTVLFQKEGSIELFLLCMYDRVGYYRGVMREPLLICAWQGTGTVQCTTGIRTLSLFVSLVLKWGGGGGGWREVGIRYQAMVDNRLILCS